MSKIKILALLLASTFVVVSWISLPVAAKSENNYKDQFWEIGDANFVAQKLADAGGRYYTSLDPKIHLYYCDLLHEELICYQSRPESQRPMNPLLQFLYKELEFDRQFTTAYVRDFKKLPEFYPIVRPWPKPLPQPKPQALYSRIAAIGYADKFWDIYNTAYNDYSASGGDDCNFVSQCLIAGGLSLWKGYDGSGGGLDNKGTIPFTDYFHLFLVDQQGADYGYIEYSGSAPDWLVAGDIIIYGDASAEPSPNLWRYAAIVVEGQGSSAKVSAHTTDSYHVAWDYVFPNIFTRANFYHLPDGVIKEYVQLKVNVAALNVRTGPGTQAPYDTPIGQIKLDQQYIAYEYVINATGKKWWHFWYDNRSAWCDSDYTVVVSENIKFKVDTESYLNVRAGPSTTYPIVSNIFYAQAFTAFEIVNDGTSDWYHFYYQGSDAWCCADYTTQIN
ncbi:MAG: amidase domain-containing protein [Candidatus Thermoplasmatota archaeon]